MNIDFNEALLAAKRMLDNYSHVPNFSKYSNGYLFTSEYISRYLPLFTPGKEKVLTVLSSGDHVFDLLTHGIKKIDTFDINVFNYFTFWLKYALILNIDFSSFKSLTRVIAKDSSLPVLEEFLNRSKEDMPEEVYNFFINLIRYQYSLNQHNGLSRLFIPTNPSMFPSSTYLKNRDEYLKLRKALVDLKISFNFKDVRRVPSGLDTSYDIILPRCRRQRRAARARSACGAAGSALLCGGGLASLARQSPRVYSPQRRQLAPPARERGTLQGLCRRGLHLCRGSLRGTLVAQPLQRCVGVPPIILKTISYERFS